MRLLYSSLLVCCCCLAASGQIQFHGVLLKDKNTDKPVPVPETRVTVAGVGGMFTAKDGRFTLVIPRDWPAGKMVQIRVQKAGYIINVPVDGEWNLPSLEEQTLRRLTVIIVPKGSLKLWSNVRIERKLNKLAQEVTNLRAESRKPRPIDFNAYFNKWSKETGVAPQEIKELFDAWNRTTGDPNDPKKQALQAVYQGNYAAAAGYFDEDANARLKTANLYQRMLDRENFEAARSLASAGAMWLREDEFMKALNKFEAAKKLLSPETHPQEWGTILQGIGVAKRSIGTRIDGPESLLALRASVAFHEQAVEVFRRARLSKHLASAESALGASLYELALRVGGDEETGLLDKAVAACQRALVIQEEIVDQQDWASTQIKLGLTLTAQATLADPTINAGLFKQAMDRFKLASEVYTRVGNKEGAATIQINIAQLLDLRANLGHEFPPQLLDEAIAARRKALEFFTQKDAPEDWAHILVGMARALTLRGNLTDGEKGEGFLNESEAVLQQALTINKKEQLAQPWARTHMELALLYHVRARRLDSSASEAGHGFMVGLLKKSVAEFGLALEVFTRESLPKDWALIQVNFAQALNDLGTITDGQSGVQLLAEAAKASRGALEVYSPEGQPGIWLMAQSNLGFILYRQALRTDGAEGERLTREAVEAYRQMLKVATPKRFLKRWTQAQSQLAVIFYKTMDAANAVASYAALLKVYPRHYDALRNSSYLYQNVLFDYEKAFQTTQRWLELYPNDRRAQMWFAEQHFTTGRFTECEKRINALLAEATPLEIFNRTSEHMRELMEMADNTNNIDVPSVIEIAPPEASVRRNLHILEIVNLLAVGQDTQVRAKLNTLILEMEAPGRFVTPSLEGVVYYVERNEGLPHRSWLRQFFNAFRKEAYEGGYRALRKARDDFKLAQP
jgi:tetratricopeptide (TPR) repeat protein